MSDFIYAPPAGLPVIYQDRDIIVVDKPSGLLSVPGRSPELDDSALTRVLASHPLARIVHRLDMDTSGLLVIALRRKAERALRVQFQARQVEKTYLAQVLGHPSPTEGTVDLPLSHASRQPPRSRVDPEHGKPSRTDYQVIGQGPTASLVRLHPRTGRSHQLRVHMLALGHPILGDRFYAPPEGQAARLMLHATSIRFAHPYSAAPMAFDSPPDFPPLP